MNNTKPIKRHESLQPLSREHHFGLLFSWKLRFGITHGISIDRIKKYGDFFYSNLILPHFEMEEKYVFPILDNENTNIQKALKQHDELTSLFVLENMTIENLKNIQKKLTDHIRFEERILFNEIQEKATSEQLLKIAEIHDNVKFNDDSWIDKFWI